MAFDPNYPVDHSLIAAADFRNQFNALKALMDAQQSTIDSQQATIASQQATIASLQSQLDDVQLMAGDSAAAITVLQDAVSKLQANNP